MKTLPVFAIVAILALPAFAAAPRVTTPAPGWVFTEDEHPSFVAAAVFGVSAL